MNFLNKLYSLPHLVREMETDAEMQALHKEVKGYHEKRKRHPRVHYPENWKFEEVKNVKE